MLCAVRACRVAEDRWPDGFSHGQSSRLMLSGEKRKSAAMDEEEVVSVVDSYTADGSGSALSSIVGIEDFDNDHALVFDDWHGSIDNADKPDVRSTWFVGLCSFVGKGVLIKSARDVFGLGGG